MKYFLILMFNFIFLNQINSQPIENYFGQINNSMVLKCNRNGGQNVQCFKNNVEIKTDEYFSKNSSSDPAILTIKKLNITDRGKQYRSKIEVSVDDASVTNECKYEIFLKEDSSKYRGELQFENQIESLTWPHIQSSNATIVVEDPYNFTINLIYQFEALPLDYLTVNNKKIPGSSQCNSSDPNLDCLKVETSQLISPDSCKHEEEIVFSYGINNEQEFNNNSLDVTPLRFPYKFYYKFKPIINIISPEKLQINKSTLIKCEVKCANPERFNFTLNITSGEEIVHQNTLTNINETSIEYQLKMDKQWNTINITCYVENEIGTAEGEKYIKFEESADPTGEGLSQTAKIIIIVVCSLAGVAIIVGLIILIYKKCIKKDQAISKKPTTTNNGKNIQNNNLQMAKMPVTTREQINENPVYGYVSKDDDDESIQNTNRNNNNRNKNSDYNPYNDDDAESDHSTRNQDRNNDYYSSELNRHNSTNNNNQHEDIYSQVIKKPPKTHLPPINANIRPSVNNRRSNVPSPYQRNEDQNGTYYASDV